MRSERIQTCLDLLHQARQLPIDDAQRRLLEQAASDFVRDGRHRRRAQARKASAAADAKLLATTATGATDRVMDAALPADTPARRSLTVRDYIQSQASPDAQQPLDCPSDSSKPPRLLNRPQRCYACKHHYQQIHHFYHRLCPPCADENLARRAARTDLTGRRAVLTGGRVKIGYQTALMLLRDGAQLTVTTRFPKDAARRFAAAPGAENWWHRLQIAALDLCDPRQVLAFTDHLLSQGLPLDILINNAAQTLRRSPHTYTTLAAAETAHTSFPPARTWTAPSFAVPGPRTTPLPWTAEITSRCPRPQSLAATPAASETVAAQLKHVMVDAAGLHHETAAANSWTLRLGQIDPIELLEVQLVNAIAPFLLADRLLPLMHASPHPRRYLINVSAVEGQFAVRNKTSDHPHTNMAKAALNMLTRTSAADLAACGIYTCSVDTGWVTDEKPLPARERHAATGWRPPLDIVDGAARIYHPIVQGQAGAPVHGTLLKDYRSVPW
ncbi:SDR family oxidoreductase [Streptomyces sp. TX20-6-3]|uniref:SDR family oxidoreductase n=1 Tax=Streptomyces sp. TX20-6-3 TaxID=3028705 RepID=UPI0029B74992|nr:SDR family oxidoreductase [Streptomyces sp. TX20-6-3]MDX2565219.1 SDR family oxidoreductase [Streptomyces sp. TX20-6-3]